MEPVGRLAAAVALARRANVEGGAVPVGQRIAVVGKSSAISVERVTGAVYYPRSTRLAQVMAPFDPTLGKATTIGAAFVALRAIKPGVPRTALR